MKSHIKIGIVSFLLATLVFCGLLSPFFVGNFVESRAEAQLATSSAEQSLARIASALERISNRPVRQCP